MLHLKKWDNENDSLIMVSTQIPEPTIPYGKGKRRLLVSHYISNMGMIRPLGILPL